jgi:hypothetical protein
MISTVKETGTATKRLFPSGQTYVTPGAIEGLEKDWDEDATHTRLLALAHEGFHTVKDALKAEGEIRVAETIAAETIPY